MPLADTLTKTMNTAEVQRLIAEAWLARDTSLVQLDRLLSDAGRSPFGVIVVDIDKSKAVATAGLSAKVSLIEQVGRLLFGGISAGEVLFSMGNDEFLIATSIQDPTTLHGRAAAIGAHVAASPVEIIGLHPDTSIRVSVSMGLVMYPDHARTAPDIYQMGLNGCFLAKQMGGSSVAWGHTIENAGLSVSTTARHAAAIRRLASDLGRSVDDTVTEALEALLRRYHRA